MRELISSLEENARSRSGDSSRRILDPARDEVLAHIPDADDEALESILIQARDRFESGDWSRMEAYDRGTVLLECARRVRSHSEELALLDSLNVGKPIAQARGDVEGAAAYLDSAGRAVSALNDDIIENTHRQMTLVVREPIGVVASIVPWNYPAALAAASISGPLAAGNSVVLKPSPETPLSAMRIAELLGELLPPGVLSVVTGGASTGRALVRHPHVDRISFTGSTSAGEDVMSGAAASFKRVGLELGGKSPTLVFDDAPFSAAVESALSRITANQGENCAAGSRLLIHEPIYDAFIDALTKRVEELTIGDPQAEQTDIGPLITADHKRRVLSLVDTGRRDSRLLAESSRPQDGQLARGFFVPVSIFETPRSSVLWRDEVFGPVLAVARFRDEAEAVSLANDTDYGLMAHIWAGDKGRALRVARSVRAGVVRVNRGFEPAFGPWGGYKASGFGRNFGKWGIEAASETKQICLDLGDANGQSTG